MRQYLAFKSQY